MALSVHWGARFNPNLADGVEINSELAIPWLVDFLRYECVRRRKTTKVVLGLSGGVDSAVVAFLCAGAFGPENVHAVRMPFKTSSADSLSHAQIVIDQLGIQSSTIEITAMAEGYADLISDITPQRLGNVCARCRMTVLFDQSAKLGALPIGTGNKTERLFGYFTWHADDSPPINPLGDLFKTQVWSLAEALDVPTEIVKKAPSADLVVGQTDEGDFGISYAKADRILSFLTQGYSREKLLEMGFAQPDVDTVWTKVAKTHWKRRLPTVAMLSTSSIGEYYLRPVDY